MTTVATDSGTPPRFGSRKQRVALIVILFLCAVTRVGWVLHIRDANPAATTSADTPTYVQPARALAEDGVLTLRPGSSYPIYERTPGYPALMGAVFTVHESETSFLVVQALLSCLTALAAYVITTALWRASVGLLAAALVAIDPLQFAASGTLLTESLSSLVLLCTVGIGFRAFARTGTNAKTSALLGLSIAGATLIRPTTYYLPIFAVILLVIRGRGGGLKHVTTTIAVFLLPIVVLIGGWQVRNHVEVGSWRYSGIEAVNVYHYRAVDALARAKGIDNKTALRQLDRGLRGNPAARCRPEHPCVPADPTRPGPFYDATFSDGLTVLRAHPVAAAEGAVRGLGRELFGPGTETIARYLDLSGSTPLKPVLAAGMLGFYLALGSGLVFVAMRPEGRALGHVFALGTAAYVLIVSAGPETYARFRGPVMPILALYAAFGLVSVVDRIRHRPPAPTPIRGAPTSP